MEDWITVIFSGIIATLISVGTLIHNIIKHHNDSIVNSITLNRIEWIGQVRELVSQFLCAYIDKEDENNLRKIALKVELMTRNKGDSNDYLPILESLQECIDTSSTNNEKIRKTNIRNVVYSTQYVLYRVWTRIRVEGGMNKKKDYKIRDKVNEVCGSYKDYLK